MNSDLSPTTRKKKRKNISMTKDVVFDYHRLPKRTHAKP